VHGEHYNLDLMVPLFHAGPIEHPDIPIHLTAVNPAMCAVAGEIADGVRPHPVCTPSYIRSVMLPAVRRGAQRPAGRSGDIEFSIAVRTDADRETLQELAALVQSADNTRARATIVGP
jgi:hypothetical protein